MAPRLLRAQFPRGGPQLGGGGSTALPSCQPGSGVVSSGCFCRADASPGVCGPSCAALSLRPRQWPFTLGAYAMKETHVFYSAFVLY